MGNEIKDKYAGAAVLGTLFILLAAELKLLDVQQAGPEMRRVGLSSLNGVLAKKLGASVFWCGVSEALGYAAITLVILLAVAGIANRMLKKSSAAKEKKRLAPGAFVVLSMLLPVLLRLFKINYGPVSPGGTPHVSYPALNTMLALYIFGAILISSDDIPPLRHIKQTHNKNRLHRHDAAFRSCRLPLGYLLVHGCPRSDLSVGLAPLIIFRHPAQA